MDWRWVLGAVVFGSILLSLYVQFLTQKHKTYTSTHRFRRKRFQPDWNRGGQREETGRRRRINFRRT